MSNTNATVKSFPGEQGDVFCKFVPACNVPPVVHEIVAPFATIAPTKQSVTLAVRKKVGGKGHSPYTHPWSRPPHKGGTPWAVWITA